MESQGTAGHRSWSQTDRVAWQCAGPDRTQPSLLVGYQRAEKGIVWRRWGPIQVAGSGGGAWQRDGDLGLSALAYDAAGLDGLEISWLLWAGWTTSGQGSRATPRAEKGQLGRPTQQPKTSTRNLAWKQDGPTYSGLQLGQHHQAGLDCYL